MSRRVELVQGEAYASVNDAAVDVVGPSAGSLISGRQCLANVPLQQQGLGQAQAEVFLVVVAVLLSAPQQLRRLRRLTADAAQIRAAQLATLDLGELALRLVHKQASIAARAAGTESIEQTDGGSLSDGAACSARIDCGPNTRSEPVSFGAMSGRTRRHIIHADMDAFYASVEQHDNPELRGEPVLVGGSPQARGVVAAASYEARAFGCRSAMPMRSAVRLCPHAKIVSPRFPRYREVSAQVMEIFESLTPLVEPLSMDEAFLDVTQRVDSGSTPEAIAVFIRERVRAVTGLTVSCGVAGTKSVAKIASDLDKPDGLTVVPPGTERIFLAPLRCATCSGWDRRRPSA